MPELPDLEVYGRNIKARLCGHTVTQVTVHKDKRLNVPAADLANHLQGAALNQITRDGKELWFAFSNGRTLSIHLMLKGQFCIVPDDGEVKHKVLTLAFDTPESLVVFDTFGWVTMTLDPSPSAIPDALSDALTLDYLKRQLQASRNLNMKMFLLDQDRLRGIGNAYADEILWTSRIAPESRCDKLPEEAITALHAAIRSILTEAIEQIHAARPGIMGGEFREFLKIHGKKQCPNGLPILCKEIADRKTYYTDEQKLYL